MNNPWRSFILVEALLFVFALWQIIHNTPLLILLILGVLSVFFSARRRGHKSGLINFVLVTGIILIFISLINSPAVWLMVVFAILFIGLRGVEISGIDLTQRAPWKKKQMMIIETTNVESKNGRRFKRPWFANERIGSNVYEWDDINIDILSGDTIIDLGNTLLPKDDNVIIVRKGFGRTRVLVPLGVDILLEHSTFLGNVTFENEKYHLKNESLKVYSDSYDSNPRRLKILTNTLVGDVEVIRV
ncbi:cell wall-active antibiotics response protein [Enterococcus sp. BWB1-3]|uniref:cell wall-active antibiotics response protein LiaF n=1 Tax=unclassified Enterococcus TaxID=2608891 RepID=UPI0019220D1D|nr:MULTISPECIES: cell wall-active antibiotics response protein LiaF [unclassified Enterococcus]MBL1228897.1 cell wall-active antibiotics response protein [Enterococcus sp. BWB1-3]MCB5951560.1 cell wall-active antibiotics response protein LiaF [Enterococcus sp. BWT-B8]MCB5954652.1 cell wall-active antibiotics response protein LiaF [Enterococcus sp. CWB-B31]